MSLIIDINYKGQRDYLHATDFYENLSELIEKLHHGKDFYLHTFTIKKFIKSLCEITFDEPNKDKVVATCKFKDNSQNKVINGWIKETGRNIIGRKEYKEDIINNKCIINKELNSIKIKKDFNYSIIENIVALAKILSYENFKISEGKWVFSRIIVFKKIYIDYNNLALEFKKSLAKKYIIFDIYIDKSYYGEIHFVVGNP